MPVSSKRIISEILDSPGGVTVRSLRDSITGTKIKKEKQKFRQGFKRKKKSYNPSKDFSRIDMTLDWLFRAGFLKKKGPVYSPVDNLTTTGTIHVNSGGNALAISETSEQILIPSEHLQGAMDKDRVRIIIYDIKKGFFAGRVCAIMARHRERFVTKIHAKTKENIIYLLLDSREQKEFISQRFKNEGNVGELAVITPGNSFQGSRQTCTVLEHYNPLDESFDLERLRIKHALPGPHPDYSDLDNIEESIPSREKKNRKDLRGLFTITIDGEHAKDFDDAISLERISDHYRLYVHIADVSAYVAPSAPIDASALERGTSYYLGDSVIPMLPEKLSNDLCSLRANTDRLALCAIMDIDNSGNMINTEFTRATIRVDHRLTYKSSAEILEKGDDEKLFGLLSEMKKLAVLLKDKRLKEGRLDLNLTDVEMMYENGKIKDIRFATRLVSHTIIEEFMLSANEAVSRTLKENNIPALYRIHEPMSKEQIGSLSRFLKTFNIYLKHHEKPGVEIQRILETVKNQNNEQVINLVVLRSLMQAYYGIEPLGHFGLGFEDYTHFTSPIRRYPDLIVHRCLKALIDGTKPPYSRQELIEIGEKSSELERVAQKAERDMIKIKSCRLMIDKIGQEFDAVISGISKNGIFVALIEIPVEGMVPLKNLTDDYYLVMETEYSVVGKKFSKRFTLGDRIRVKLQTVQIETLRIDFATS